MSELSHEYRKRNEYEYRCNENRYHTVEKGFTDSLDSEELDLYRYMRGGMQGK